MPEKAENKYKHHDLHQKVQDYMFVCESDEESEYHWRYLKALYRKLREKKNLPEAYHGLLGELDGFMSKYAQQDSGEDQADPKGTDLFKYRGEA